MAVQVLIKRDPVKLVTDNLLEAQRARWKYERIWNEVYRMYQMTFDPGDRSVRTYRSRIYVPIIFSVIEDFMPLGMDPFITSDIKATVYDRVNESQKYAEISQYMLNYQLDEEIKYFFRLYDAWKQCALYGWSPIKLIWKKAYRNMTETEVVERNGEKYLKPTKIKKKYIDAPHWVIPDVFKVFPSPYSTPDYIPWVIEKLRIPYEELLLKQEAGVYKNVEKLLEINSFKSRIGESIPEAREDSVGEFYQGPTDSRTFVNALEMWTSDRVITVGENQILLRNTGNPYYHGEIPYKFLRYTRMTGEFFSKGAAEPLRFMQHEVNTIRNQRRDNVSIILNKMWEVVTNSVDDEDELVSQPAGIIHVNAPGMVREIEQTDVTQSAYAEENYIRKDSVMTSGIQDVIVGRQGGAEKTATESTQLLRQAQGRVKLVIQSNQEVIREAFAMTLKLDQQFLPKEKLIRIFSKAGYYYTKISKFDIHGDFDVGAAVSNTAMSSDVARNQFIAALQLVTTNPRMDNELKHKAVVKEIFHMFGIRKAEDLLKEREEISVLDIQKQLDENAKMMRGEVVEVSPEDDDALHIKLLVSWTKHNGIMVEDKKFPLFIKHKDDHEQQMRAKEKQNIMQLTGNIQGAGPTNQADLASSILGGAAGGRI